MRKEEAIVTVWFFHRVSDKHMLASFTEADVE